MEDRLTFLRVMFTGGFRIMFCDCHVLLRARYLVFLTVKESEMNLVFSPHDILPRAFAFGDGGTSVFPERR